ncbi:MAG: DegT/DnrJ/EryC1/StrS family aminotransferase [Candidatus Altimarinota bacterium]
MSKSLINIALSPNSSADEVKLGLRYLMLPWNWLWFKQGPNRMKLEKSFGEKFGFKYVYGMGSGREALYLILKGLGLEKDDEIILQGFTCMVVVNSIAWNGLKPVYVDIDESNYNIDLELLIKKIGPKTKAVMIQHTFGIPAQNVKEIAKLCKEKGVLLIEDCAHAMGAEVEGLPVGRFGDIAFYSLGRSKVISCVNGGLIALNDESLNKKIIREIEKIREKNWLNIWQDLHHPVVMEIAKKLSVWSKLSKVYLKIIRVFRLINLEVNGGEKRAIKPAHFPTRLANATAEMARLQFNKLDIFNEKRKYFANKYWQELKDLKELEIVNPENIPGAIWLRYPIKFKKVELAEKVFRAAKGEGIILGDWYKTVVAPADIDQSKSFYEKGECPKAEKVCAEILNLPTHFGLRDSDAEMIIKLIKANVAN